MTDSKSLATCYKYHRQQQNRRLVTLRPNSYHGGAAVDALGKARDDVAAGKARYPDTYSGAGIGAENESKLRWIERPADIGLRFVGFADEIAKRHDRRLMIDHTGWYTSEYQDSSDVMRGVVFQLPARKGESVYVAGYMQGGPTRNKGWTSTYNGASPEDSGACLAIRAKDWIIGDRGGTESGGASDLMEACRDADRIAELESEKERNYQAVWSLGSQYAGHREEVKSATAKAKALLTELKAAREALHRDELPTGVTLSTVCGALKNKLENLRAQRVQALESMRKIIDDNMFRGDIRGAFMDGASMSESEAKRIGI